MSSLFKGPKTTASVPAAGLRITTSLQGKPIPIVYGQGRLALNLIDYQDFASRPASSSIGGKGFGNTSAAQSGFAYSANVLMALCEGPVNSILAVYQDSTANTLASYNFTTFLGGYSQTAWAYFQTLHPDLALAYRGLAYVGAGPFDLGSSPNLPQITLEVKSSIADGISGQPDADPKDVIVDLLTNVNYGVGYPSAHLGTWATYSAYCRALGLVISIEIVSSQECRTIIADILKFTNSEALCSDNVIKIVPRGDQSITANGATYTAPSAPLYSLGDDDLYIGGGSGGSAVASSTDPIACTRKRQSDQMNVLRIEYLDRASAYNPATTEWKDDGSISLFGERYADVLQGHFFRTAAPAQTSISLLGGLAQILNNYVFMLTEEYFLLEPMDLVAVTDARLGLSAQVVRIFDITENGDGSYTFTAEDYLAGTASTPIYGSQPNAGYAHDYNASPGDVNAPVFFEPTDQLAGGLAVWAAVSGQTPAVWGGCDVWVSTDGVTYSFVETIRGPSRYGILTASLASYTEAPEPPTIDQTNTLAVDLAVSGGELASGSTQDALALSTACWVDGEVIAYRDASLTGGNAYNLTYLARGAYGTEADIGVHEAGVSFVRLDNSLLKIPFNQSLIGTTLYIKFLSFNIWNGAKQGLSDVSPYAYTILGTALASPLPSITNLRTVFIDRVTNLTWDEIADFRGVRYEIRLGTSSDSALSLGNVAHPPFVIPGNGTYWVAAVSQPIAGLTVYSDTWEDVTVGGSSLVENVVVTWDEMATGWTGTFGGGAGIDGTSIRTGSSGNILDIADFLGTANILDYGGNQNGSYTIPAAHRVDVGYVAPCLITVKYLPTGVAINSDILSLIDFLGTVDILGSAGTRFIDVRPQIRITQDQVSGSPTWTDWQDFAPGNYLGRGFDFQLLLETIDRGTICYDLQFSFTVDVPDRIDSNGIVGGVITSLTNLALASGGTTITFLADTAVAAVGQPFNGGPAGTTAPNLQVTVRNATAGDDVMLTSVSLSQCTVQVKNGGSGVARNVDIRPQGY